MPLSPSAASLTSPKGLPPNPNLNPFSALSPDLEPRPLQPLGSRSQSSRPFIHYSRRNLLKLAQRQRNLGVGPPPSMNPLDAWFGPTSTTHNHMHDPAIASIGPPSRSGGFGEGFGFGGGIGGGKALGRGARLGTRRTNDTQAEAMSGGQMGRFSTKPSGERNRIADDTRKDAATQDRRPRREGEWRRNEPLPPHRSFQTRGHPQQADDVEPAWMDDAETFGNDDPAIAGSSGTEGLVHFVPGEDMIAAHRKDRNTDSWRAGSGKPLVSFFGAGQPLIEPVKAPKVFNAADYLLPSKTTSEEVDEDSAPMAEPSTGFQSRFQRFFAGAPSSSLEEPREEIVEPTRRFQSPLVSPPPPERSNSEPASERVDDHMAKLMGLLSAKSPPAPTPSPSQRQPPPGFANPNTNHAIATSSHLHQQHPQHPQHLHRPPQPIPPQHSAASDHIHSHLPDPRQAFYPPPPPPDYRPFTSFPGDHSGRMPDAQQLLTSVSQRPPVHHPAHMPMPPPPPGMAHMDMRSQQRPPYPDMVSPHDLLRELQYPREYAQHAPRYHDAPPFAPPAHFSGPPHPHPQAMPPYPRPPGQLNDAQQDMLATLFAGLPAPGR